jgi:hypothetical protein
MPSYQLTRTDVSYATITAVDADEARRLADRHPEFWDICIGDVICVDEATGEPLQQERTAHAVEAQCNANDNPQPKKESTMTPHKHAALIKQWADGAIIQIKLSDGRWMDIAPGLVPNWYPATEFRVKPPAEKIKYKRFLWRSTLSRNRPNRAYVLMVTPDEQSKERRETFIGFIRWIDTEWQEVEV